ncbi:hypothetical protein KC865_02525 [Candidatus Kaiserbacteria bacterium]|nr:hypothetical protein [Candidatus Kaiserbacteria bacterium]USN91872.1 MAG: hypothetical protein H6782_03285 [Candidatus Nomurabacteria bacterium]
MVKIISVALIVLIFVLGAYYFLMQNRQPTKQEICASYDGGLRGGSCLEGAPDYCRVVIYRAGSDSGMQDGGSCGYAEQ